MTEEKKPFTKEEAKSLSILDVARGLGMEMKQSSQREYYWEEHDSLKIHVQKNRFDWYSRDLHGDTIALVQAVKDVSFKEALQYLETGTFEPFTAPPIKVEPFRYFLSRYEEPFQEARDYLREVRGLSDETIDVARQAGVIAQATKKAPDNHLESVVVFKSLDKKGNIIGASLQGIEPNKERYEKKGYLKQILANSDGLAGMSLDIGSPKRLVFSESPIDLLSYYEANRDHLSDVRLVSMDGLKEGVMARYTLELLAELHGQLDYQVDRGKVYSSFEALFQTTTFFKKAEHQDFLTLAIDNDQAAVAFLSHLREKGVVFQEALPPKAEGREKMDWNDYVKEMKEHQKMEKEKALEELQAQENDRTNGGTDSLQPKAEGSVEPVAQKATFEQTVTSHPTSSYPLLHFSTNFEKVQRRIGNYHPIDQTDLRRLNQYASSLQITAQWYLSELADKKINYIYLNKGQVNLLQVNFKKENFIHLAGIRPFEPGKTAADFLVDFAQGNGNYRQLLISNSIKDKLQVLPMLSDILDSHSFVLNDLTSVEKLHNLNLSKAIQSKDADFFLLFKDVESELIPASLMKLKGELATHIENVEDKVILGIYRERDGQIDQLSINENYIKDGGREMHALLQNGQVELVKESGESIDPILYTRLLDASYNISMTAIQDKTSMEAQTLLAMYEDHQKNLEAVVVDGLSKGWIDKDSNFYKEWIDDQVYDQYHYSSTDVLNGRISPEVYENFIRNTEAKLFERTLPQAPEITEKHVDRDGDGYSDIVEETLGTDPLDPLSNPRHKTESDTKKTSVSDLLDEKDMAALSLHLKEGLNQYTSSEQYRRFLETMSKFHTYSVSNIQLMLEQNPAIRQVASYQSWKKEFGRQVQKGEKGLKIRVPMSVRLLDKDGQPLLDENGKERTVTRFKLGTVFDVAQTEGKDLPQPIYRLESGVPDYENLYRAAREIAKEDGVSISFQKIDNGANGYFHFGKKEIVLADKGMSEAHIMKTLFHEMAYSHLHGKGDGFTKHERELQAESIAYIVSSHVGIDTSDYSFGYLHGWSEDRGNYQDLEAQLKVIQVEAKSMIGRLESQLENIKSQSKTLDTLQEKLAETKKTVEKNRQEKQKMEVGLEPKSLPRERKSSPTLYAKTHRRTTR